jgi:hypothetical protein
MLDSSNPTAATFRSAETSIADGALVVPLMTAAGCVGTLALELERDAEHSPKTASLRPLATIVAAMLAPLVGGQTLGASQDLLDARSRESA